MGEFTTASKDGGVEVWRFEPGGSGINNVCRVGPACMNQFVWDDRGEHLAVWDDERLLVVEVSEAGTCKVKAELPLGGPVESTMFGSSRWIGVKLDRKGENFLLRDTDGTAWPNLAVHDRLGEDCGSPFQFYGNDILCYMASDRTLRILDSAKAHNRMNLSEYEFVIAEKITDFAIGPLRANPRVMVVAVFKGAQETEQAKISIVYVDIDAKTHDYVVADQTLGRATEVEMKWNKIGSVLLIKESAAVDQSGGSYYGSSQLFSLRTARNAEVKVIVSREKGPIQFYGWSSTEREVFFMGYGPLPCQIEMWSAAKNTPKLDLGRERRNYLAVSNSSKAAETKQKGGEAPKPPNLVLIGGFGNLPGDVEIWDMTTQKIVGQAKLPWTVGIDFSPDNLLLLASTTTPRLRVDNCLKIVRYNGEPLATREFQELYRAAWRPRPDVRSQGLDPKVGVYKQTSAKAVDTGLVLRKKGGVFGGALSAALSRTTPTTTAEPRVAVRATEKKAKADLIPGIAAGSTIPGAPAADAHNPSMSKRSAF